MSLKRKGVRRVKVKFKKDRDTKNTVRFDEVIEPGKPPVIGTLYVQKWFAGDREEIVIEIEDVKK
jgi:hypothetical protein